MDFEPAPGEVTVTVENVGGIDHTTVDLHPGVNVLAGRNATNRTSFLQAIMAGVGSDAVSLKGDADEGRVTLSIGEGTYTRTLVRTADGVSMGGEPYLEDATTADLYAFLLESNDARRAVARGEDLHELIVRPVDTAELRAEIHDREAERRRLDDRLDDLESAADRRVELQRRQEELEEKRERLAAQLAEKEAALDEADVTAERPRQNTVELEALMDDLTTLRADLDDVRFKLESHRESLASVRAERRDLVAELADRPAPDDGAPLEERLEAKREEKRRIDAQVTQLQSLLRFNQELVEGDSAVRELFREGDASAGVTQGLVSQQDARCWACGSEVSLSQFEEMLDTLRDLNREKRQERSRLADEIAELTDAVETRERRQAQREELERRLDRLDDEIEEREAAIERLTAERETLTGRIQRLEAEVRALGTDDYDDVLELHREANRLEFELDRVDETIETVAADRREVETQLEERDDLQTRRDAVEEELDELRTRVDRLEATAVESFNDHMAELLDLLEYDNLERIWIERREQADGSDATEQPSFDLHVVRTTDSGAVYDDTVGHLSESEREVTGLVFALAGYLVHDVHETVPFVLLDSLEAIDASRIATLVDYFADYAPYLVVALLPEDASALDETYRRVTEI
jgi:DNA repair exonuclease SbcCD ATPase subunit